MLDPRRLRFRGRAALFDRFLRRETRQIDEAKVVAKQIELMKGGVMGSRVIRVLFGLKLERGIVP